MADQKTPRLTNEMADVMEDFLLSDGWLFFMGIVDERIADRERQLRSGRCANHSEYVQVCESIREAEYLRDRPVQLIREARMGR